MVDRTWLGIALLEKGLGALEDFISSRFQLYLHLYNHKTVGGFRWLLTKAIEEVLVRDDNDKYIEESIFDTNNMKYFTDSFFWEKFRDIAKTNDKSASFYLLNRYNLQHIVSEKYEKKDKLDIIKNRKTTELENIYGKDKIICWECDAKFSKIAEDYEKIQILVKDKVKETRRLYDVTERTRFFEKFKDTRILHFYLNPF